jgi:hypothetical protein
MPKWHMMARASPLSTSNRFLVQHFTQPAMHKSIISIPRARKKVHKPALTASSPQEEQRCAAPMALPPPIAMALLL